MPYTVELYRRRRSFPAGAGILLGLLSLPAAAAPEPPVAEASAVPEEVRAVLAQAETRAAGGDLVGARRELTQAAERWMEAGAYSRAEPLLAAAVELDPSPRSLLLLGRARALDRRYRAAAEPLRRAYEAGWREPRAVILLAQVLWENGDLDGAEALLRTASGPAGAGLEARHELGRLQLWRGNSAAALESLTAVVAARPGRPGPLLDLANAQAAGGRLAEARRSFAAYLAAHPDDPRAVYGLARVLGRLGEGSEAAALMERFRHLTEAERERVRREGLQAAALDEASFLIHRGEAGAALEHLATLEETPSVLAMAARAHRARGDLPAALRALERAVAAAPERADLRDQLAEAYRALDG